VWDSSPTTSDGVESGDVWASTRTTVVSASRTPPKVNSVTSRKLSITFTNKAEASKVLPPADQQQVAAAPEDDAELLSNTQLEKLLADEPEPIQDEIIRINTDARPLALQVALLIPILAGLVGLLNSFRTMRLPDPTPSSGVEGMSWADLAASGRRRPVAPRPRGGRCRGRGRPRCGR
jgi:hypothetical protein